MFFLTESGSYVWSDYVDSVSLSAAVNSWLSVGAIALGEASWAIVQEVLFGLLWFHLGESLAVDANALEGAFVGIFVSTSTTWVFLGGSVLSGIAFIDPGAVSASWKWAIIFLDLSETLACDTDSWVATGSSSVTVAGDEWIPSWGAIWYPVLLITVVLN